MLISRLRNFNLHLKKFTKMNNYLQVNKLNKIFPNFYCTISIDCKFERIKNFTNEKNFKYNGENLSTTHNYKLQKMERIISYLDNYNSKTLDENFYSLLLTFYKNFLFTSKSQCFKIPNISSAIERILSRIYKFNLTIDSFHSINQAKGILYFIYVLEKKNLYNITREENNSIIPKIVNYLEDNHSNISISDLLEIIQISVHFGITFDTKLIENRIKNEINSVNFETMNHVVRNLHDHKYNKLNYYKTIYINMFLNHYIEEGLKEKINNKLSLLHNLSIISIDLFMLDTYHDILRIMLNIQKEFLINENIHEELNQNSIVNLFESINNLNIIHNFNIPDSKLDMILSSRDFVMIIKKLYDHISTNMINVEMDKINSTMNRNKNTLFNFPLFLLLIKNISSTHEQLLPNEDQVKTFYKFIKNNLINSSYVHREAIFCFKLMGRRSNIDNELAESIRKHLIDHIHYLNADKYPLDLFNKVFAKIYQNDKAKFDNDIMKSFNKNVIYYLDFSKSKNKPIALFRLMTTCICISDSNKPHDICEKVFNRFLNSLNTNPREILLKEFYKILEYSVINQIVLNKKHADILNLKLICFINENKEHYQILDMTSTKIMIHLEHLNILEHEMKSTFEMREKLINYFLYSKFKHVDGGNQLKVFNEMRMLAENNINIHPHTLHRFSKMLKLRNYRLHENQLENFFRFVYILLKKTKTFQGEEINLKNTSAVEELISNINLQVSTVNINKINVSSTIYVLSKILKEIKNSKQIYDKLNQIYSDLILLQSRKKL